MFSTHGVDYRNYLTIFFPFVVKHQKITFSLLTWRRHKKNWKNIKKLILDIGFPIQWANIFGVYKHQHTQKC